MIIDTHYHSVRMPADENIARELIAECMLQAKNGGLVKSLDEVMPLYRDYLDDSECDKLIGRMDESGIGVTVLNVVDNINFGLDNQRILRINSYCARTATKHPGRIIAMAGIDPRRPDAPALFRRCIQELNMKGLKIHPDDGYYPNSKEAYTVLKVASELGVPLLTHTGPLPHSRAKYAHPIHLDDILVDFPKLNVIAAHMGDMWWRDWATLAKHKSNLYGDLAMWQFIAESKPALFYRYLREILDIVGPDKVLFSSDGPVFEPIMSNKRWVEIIKNLPNKKSDGIRFSEEEVEAILGGNAQRVFKL